jgi:tetratricopeptide (TPR) repeat protein
MKAKKFQKALNLCENLVSKQHVILTFNDWFNKGLCHFNLDQHMEAVYSYDRALSIEEKNLPAMTNKGISLLHLNRAKDAFVLFHEVFSINPNIGPA